MATETYRIVAPITSLNQAQKVIDAGADELYCGALFDEWTSVYGDSDLLSRRQGACAHVSNRNELVEIAHLAAETNRIVALTVNARYTQDQQNRVLDLIASWEEMGGRAIIVTDLGILLRLRFLASPLQCHLSLLAGIYNSQSAAFFADLGVTRIVLPRQLSIAEISSLIANGPPRIEYECLVLNQKCQFIDGMCSFYHGTRLPQEVPCVFSYKLEPDQQLPVARSHDPLYEGHGCHLDWQTPTGPVHPLQQDDEKSPHCAACQFQVLGRAGVKYFKIAGRAYETALIVRGVKFLREALALWDECESSGEASDAIISLYSKVFGSNCGRRKCYYVL